MNPPDINASSGINLKVILVVVALVLTGGTAGWFYLSDDEKEGLDTSGLFNGLPDDYFNQPDEPVEEVQPVKKRAIKKPVAKKKKPKTVYSRRLERPQIDYAALREQALRKKLNEARRGKSGAYVLTQTKGDDGFRVKWINKDKDYTNQASATVGRETSFPVDLTRTLTTDRNISANLVDAINSELPGKIRAQIDINIYAAHGRKVLIPAGSMAVGAYAPLGKVGDSRIRAIWTRIIRPDGVNIVLSGAEMADAMGRSGLTGKVDNRMWERFGSALLISTISTAGQYVVSVKNQNEANAVNNLSRDMSQAAVAHLEQHIDLRPIVEIPAGSVIQITPVEDIWFKKPVKKIIFAEAVNRK